MASVGNQAQVPENVQITSGDDQIFSISRDFLEKESEYFRGLLSSGMRESEEKAVYLPTLSSTALTVISDYSNNKEQFISFLSPDNIQEIITAINYLQMCHLMESCVEYVACNMTTPTCYSYHKLGTDLMIPDLVQVANKHMKVNFDEFFTTHPSRTISFKELIELLGSDDLTTESELNVFNAMVAWFRYNRDIENRAGNKDFLHDDDYIEMVKCTRYGLLTSEHRQHCITTMKNDHFPEQCFNLPVFSTDFNPDAIWLTETHKHWCQLRKGSSKSVLVATGGFTKRSENSTIRTQFLVSDELYSQHHLRKLRRRSASQEAVVFKKMHASGISMPVPICEHGTCVLDNYLYAAGGQIIYKVDGASTQNRMWRFNPRTTKWQEMCPMHQPRSLFCLLALGDFIYAVCGWLQPDTVNRTVERYDPTTDTWQFVASIDIGLHEHAGCVHDGQLYISGGYKGPFRGHLDKSWSYNPQADTWTALAPMYQARSYHVMVTLADQKKILVVGGVSSEGGSDFEDIQNCELYDPIYNQWSIITTIPHPASCMPYYCSEGFVYLFGSHAFHNESDSHELVQILNTGDWTWTERKMTSNDTLFFALSVLHLPRGFVRKLR